MALALKKYTLIPTAEGTLDPLYPDGNTAPEAPVLATVVEVVSALQLNVTLQTQSTGGVPPLVYTLERSEVSASTGFSTLLFNAFSPIEDYIHEDTGLTPDTAYWYRCFATDSNSTPRQSGYSNVVTGITEIESGDVNPPTVPGSFTSTGVTTTTITLSWTAATDT